MTKNIFNIPTTFNFHASCNATTRNDVEEQINIYPDSTQTPLAHIHIGTHRCISNYTQRNPSIHYDSAQGFRMQFLKYFTEIEQQSDGLHFYVDYDRYRHGIMWYLKKLYNIEYTSIEERISQVLNEFVLVPMTMFFSNYLLIHSSGLTSPTTGRAILLGGTGGVGKTSLELELCRKHKFGFLNDDIAIVDNNGMVHPNLAFPKIYAYNLQNQGDLRQRVFDNKPWHNKLAWTLKTTLQGMSATRRKMSPQDLFPVVCDQPVALGQYIILNRTTSSKATLHEISGNQAAAQSLKVIQTEYFPVYNHFYWHEYNALCGNYAPIIHNNKIFDRWNTLSKTLFNTIPCYQLNIPATMPHQEFMREISAMLLNIAQ